MANNIKVGDWVVRKSEAISTGSWKFERREPVGTAFKVASIIDENTLRLELADGNTRSYMIEYFDIVPDPDNIVQLVAEIVTTQVKLDDLYTRLEKARAQKENPFGELEIGDRFMRHTGDEYILVASSVGQYILVNLKYGTCYSDPVSYKYGVFAGDTRDFKKL